MEIWVYNGMLFHTEEDASDWIASNELYLGEEGLLSIIENELYCIDTFEELLDFVEENGYTIEEVCKQFDIDLKEFLK